MAQATMRAVDDGGLKLSDVDGLFVAATQVRMGPMALAEYLRIKPKYFDGTIIGGWSFMSHVTHAQAAIEAGLCEVAVIAYGSTQRSVSRAAASPREYNHYESPYKPDPPDRRLCTRRCPPHASVRHDARAARRSRRFRAQMGIAESR